MNGSIMTNEMFKEQVELFKRKSTPQQRKTKKKQIVSNTNEDNEISLHDASNDDKDLEESDKEKKLQRMKAANNKSLFQTHTLENALQCIGIIHRHITGKNLKYFEMMWTSREIRI